MWVSGLYSLMRQVTSFMREESFTTSAADEYLTLRRSRLGEARTRPSGYLGRTLLSRNRAIFTLKGRPELVSIQCYWFAFKVVPVFNIRSEAL